MLEGIFIKSLFIIVIINGTKETLEITLQNVKRL